MPYLLSLSDFLTIYHYTSSVYFSSFYKINFIADGIIANRQLILLNLVLRDSLTGASKI